MPFTLSNISNIGNFTLRNNTNSGNFRLLISGTPSPTPSPTTPAPTTPAPTSVTPSPTAATPSPTAATPAPTRQPTPSPTAATPSPTAATPSPTAATPSPTTSPTPSPTPAPTSAGIQSFRNVVGSSVKCDVCGLTRSVSIYSKPADNIPALGVIIYTDASTTTPFNGNSLWYYVNWTPTTSWDLLQINSSGAVIGNDYCVNCPTPSPTAAPTAAPTAPPPTTSPTAAPTAAPTASPTAQTVYTYTLGFSTVNGLTACANRSSSPGTYYSYNPTFTVGTILYTVNSGGVLSSNAITGFYSDGSTYGNVTGNSGVIQGPMTSCSTPSPTAAATPAPTRQPTPSPTVAATPAPTRQPTPSPTVAATPAPTAATPSPTAGSFSYFISSIGEVDAATACANYDAGQTVYAASSNVSSVTQFFDDSGLTSAFNGGSEWWAYARTTNPSVVRRAIVSGGGNVSSAGIC